MTLIFQAAKQRIENREPSKLKDFALSVCFERVTDFIEYYSNEAKANVTPQGKAEFVLNKKRSELDMLETESELKALSISCDLAIKEFGNAINNVYNLQYKKDFNFFSFKVRDTFEWAYKNEALFSIYYYLAYRQLQSSINAKLDEITNSKKKDHTKMIWFKVGLLFATGEIKDLIEAYNGNATQIAKYKENKSYRPYISESVAKTNTSDKNIFSDVNKLSEIHTYCIENKIKMCEDFLKEYNKIEPE